MLSPKNGVFLQKCWSLFHLENCSSRSFGVRHLGFQTDPLRISSSLWSARRTKHPDLQRGRRPSTSFDVGGCGCHPRNIKHLVFIVFTLHKKICEMKYSIEVPYKWNTLVIPIKQNLFPKDFACIRVTHSKDRPFKVTRSWNLRMNLHRCKGQMSWYDSSPSNHVSHTFDEIRLQYVTVCSQHMMTMSRFCLINSYRKVLHSWSFLLSCSRKTLCFQVGAIQMRNAQRKKRGWCQANHKVPEGFSVDSVDIGVALLQVSPQWNSRCFCTHGQFPEPGQQLSSWLKVHFKSSVIQLMSDSQTFLAFDFDYDLFRILRKYRNLMPNEQAVSRKKLNFFEVSVHGLKSVLGSSMAKKHLRPRLS